MPNPSFAHEIAVVLPFFAVLSGRLLAEPLIRARLEPVLAVGLAAYLGALCYGATGVPAPAQNQAVADWLVAHHLTDGLAGYWEANSVTFDSGGRVTVAPLAPGTTTAYHWEAKVAWFDTRSRYANFLILKALSAAAPRSLACRLGRITMSNTPSWSGTRICSRCYPGPEAST